MLLVPPAAAAPVDVAAAVVSTRVEEINDEVVVSVDETSVDEISDEVVSADDVVERWGKSVIAAHDDGGVVPPMVVARRFARIGASLRDLPRYNAMLVKLCRRYQFANGQAWLVCCR